MRINLSISTILISAGAIACSGSAALTPPPTVVGYTIALTTSPPATASAGSPVHVTFAVTENESNGTSNPAGNQAINVVVTAGNGTVNGSASAMVTTAADGSASLTWVLGPATGSQTLRGSLSAAQFVDASVTAASLPTLLVTNASCTSGGCRTLEVRAFVEKFNVPGQLPTGMGFIGYVRPGQWCLPFPPAWTLTVTGPNKVTIITWTPRDTTRIWLVAVDSAIHHGGPKNQAQLDSMNQAIYPFDSYGSFGTVGETAALVVGEAEGWTASFPAAPKQDAALAPGTACSP